MVDEIEDLYAIGRPVLVGTISIEKSELLSRLLRHRGIPHNVLNAKQHEREAEIVAQAGRYQAVTIATNMAGRGTDILLGGNAEFRTREELRQRGLDPATVPADEWQAVYAEIKAQTDKNASWSCRRETSAACISSARSATKAGASTISFAAAPAGKVIRAPPAFTYPSKMICCIFGSDRLSSIMGKLGMVEGEPIEHRMITKAIEGAQRKVEGHNFEIRKHLLEYDDVMNKQREVIYELRTQVLGADQLKDTFLEMLEEVVDDLVAEQLSADLHPEEWDLAALQEAIKRQFGVEVNVQEFPAPGPI